MADGEIAQKAMEKFQKQIADKTSL